MFDAVIGSNRGMKNSFQILLILVGLYSALPAQASILPGQVTGHTVLGCIVTNFTGTKQILDQVQYQYACNHGPNDPYHTYFQVYPCFGNCEIESGHQSWQTNGPWTQNCILLNSNCQGWGHEAPRPRPSPGLEN